VVLFCLNLQKLHSSYICICIVPTYEAIAFCSEKEALLIQTWFYEANKKAEIGKRKYWIYYKKGIVTVKMVKSGMKKAEFRFKAEKNQVCL